MRAKNSFVTREADYVGDWCLNLKHVIPLQQNEIYCDPVEQHLTAKDGCRFNPTQDIKLSFFPWTGKIKHGI